MSSEKLSSKTEIQHGSNLYNFLGGLAAVGFLVGVFSAFSGATYAGKQLLELVGFNIKVLGNDFSDPVGWLAASLYAGAPAAIGAGKVMDRYYSGPVL